MLDHSNDNVIKKLDSGILSPEESEKETFMQLVRDVKRRLETYLQMLKFLLLRGKVGFRPWQH